MARKKTPSRSEESKKAPSDSRKRKTPLVKKKDTPSRTASRSGRKTATAPAVNHDAPPADPPDLHARIADRAHELYTHRGGHHGMDWQDWFEAERQILEEEC